MSLANTKRFQVIDDEKVATPLAGPYRKEFADARLGVYVSFDFVMICGELFDLASGKQLDIADSIAAVRKALCLL